MYGVVIVPAPITENPITSFDAIPLSIPPGGQAALSWIIHTGATSAGINQGVGNVLPLTTGGVGNASVTPATDTTYTLSVTSPAGNDSRTASVQVRPLGFFQASNTLIAPGAPVTLSWRIRQDASATLTGVGSVAPHTAPDGTGSVVLNPSATTTYVLSSTASGRTEEASATVVLRPVGTQFALIDIGGTGGQVEPGAVGGIVVGAGPHDTNGVDLAPVSLTSDTGDEFTIAIDNIDPSGIPIGGLDWRDRGNAPAAPLAFLVEDFVKNNLGMVHVTLGGLPAGTYDVISYHLDPDNSQCSNIRILVTDATRLAEDTNVLGDASYPDHPNNTNVPNVGGLTTGLADSKSARFQITSNGTDAVMIYFDGNTDPIDDEVPLDGLWLTLATPAEPFDIVNVTRTTAGGSASVTIEFDINPGPHLQRLRQPRPRRLDDRTQRQPAGLRGRHHDIHRDEHPTQHPPPPLPGPAQLTTSLRWRLNGAGILRFHRAESGSSRACALTSRSDDGGPVRRGLTEFAPTPRRNAATPR